MRPKKQKSKGERSLDEKEDLKILPAVTFFPVDRSEVKYRLIEATDLLKGFLGDQINTKAKSLYGEGNPKMPHIASANEQVSAVFQSTTVRSMSFNCSVLLL